MPTLKSDEGDDHHHHDCGAKWDGEFACLDLESQTIPLAVLVCVLVLFALVAEHIIHKAVHAAQHDRFWRNFTAAMLAELSMLGLISFVLFAISQASSIGENQVLLIEFVHLTLFCMMIIYYSLVGVLAKATKRALLQCREHEADLIKFNLIDCITELRTIQQQREARWWFVLFPFGCNGKLEARMFGKLYLLTRHYFLVSQGLPTDLPFDYAEYIDRCTSALCVKMVQVGWRMWTSLLAFVVISGMISYYIDYMMDGEIDVDEDDFWTDDVNSNATPFWGLFCIVWFLFVVNGIVWARVERSRAKLVLLSAKMEIEDRNFDRGDANISTSDRNAMTSPGSIVNKENSSTVSGDQQPTSIMKISSTSNLSERKTRTAKFQSSSHSSHHSSHHSHATNRTNNTNHTNHTNHTTSIYFSDRYGYRLHKLPLVDADGPLE